MASYKKKKRSDKSKKDDGLMAKARRSGLLGSGAKGRQDLQDKYGDSSYKKKKRKK